MKHASVVVALFVWGCSQPPSKEPNSSANATPNNTTSLNVTPNNTTPLNSQNSTSPTIVDANDFDQTCEFDYDCDLVWGGDVCGCGTVCPDAISSEALADFEAAIAAVECPENGEPQACPGAACQEMMAVCSGEVCTAAVPVVLEASQFDQSCEVDEDCVLVSTGPVCDACRCARGAISVNAKAEYDAARSAIECNPGPSPCDCAEFEPAFCFDGTCAGGSGG